MNNANEMTVAEELASKYREPVRDADSKDVIDRLVADWSVKVQTISIAGIEGDPTYYFEDGSSISMIDRVANPPSRAFGELNDEEKEVLLRKLRSRVRSDENDVKFLKSLGVKW